MNVKTTASFAQLEILQWIESIQMKATKHDSQSVL